MANIVDHSLFIRNIQCEWITSKLTHFKGKC